MYSFNFFSLLSLLAGNAILILAVYILLKNPRSLVNRLFALFGLSIFIWGLGEGMQRASVSAETVFFWFRYMTGSGSAFHSPLLLHFWLVFSGQIEKFKKKVPVFVLYLPSLIFFAMRFFHPEMFTKELVRQYWGYSAEQTTLGVFYMVYLVLCDLVFIRMAFKTASQTSGKLKRQAQYIGWGIVFSLCVSFATQVCRPLFHFSVPELTVISFFVFVLLCTYAINKYGLLTITTKLIAENIIGTMEDYVIAIDKQMKIAFANDSAIGGLGYKETELINQPIGAFLSSDISKLSYDQALERFPLRNYQAEIMPKDGAKISVSANASVLRDGHDNFGFVFALRDMSQINGLISGLEQSKRELEASRDDLAKSKKELERKNKEFEEANENLERMNKLMMGRELKMIELKKEIQELKKG